MGCMEPEKLKKIVSVLESAGVVCIENAVPPDVIKEAHAMCINRWSTLYNDYIKPYEEFYGGDCDVGSKRFKEVVLRADKRYDMAHGLNLVSSDRYLIQSPSEFAFSGASVWQVVCREFYHHSIDGKDSRRRG